jgi:hypothetical protein
MSTTTVMDKGIQSSCRVKYQTEKDRPRGVAISHLAGKMDVWKPWISHLAGKMDVWKPLEALGRWMSGSLEALGRWMSGSPLISFPPVDERHALEPHAGARDVAPSEFGTSAPQGKIFQTQALPTHPNRCAGNRLGLWMISGHWEAADVAVHVLRSPLISGVMIIVWASRLVHGSPRIQPQFSLRSYFESDYSGQRPS